VDDEGLLDANAIHHHLDPTIANWLDLSEWAGPIPNRVSSQK